MSGPNLPAPILTTTESGVARGQWLRTSRRASGRSVARMADETGIDAAKIEAWESFTCNMPDQSFAFLRRYFQTLAPTRRPGDVEIIVDCYIVLTIAGWLVTPRRAGEAQRRMFPVADRAAALAYARRPVRRETPNPTPPDVRRPTPTIRRQGHD